MIETVYLEKEIKNHPRADKIINRVNPKRVIEIERYQELFNLKSQSFRLQKNKPSLILAKKHGKFIHPIPEKYGIGGKENYYFSHLLNCPFDCQYCFLQGLYRSANYVLFINYEDFMEEISKKKDQETYFFSGYDADSLALEPKSHFVAEFLPFFESLPHSFLELRTKSIFTRPLINHQAIANCIVAYTLSPESICKEVELKAPPLHKRLKSIVDLQQNQWKIGLRFDPLIYVDNFESTYKNFFQEVFSKINLDLLHSVTLGTFRLPSSFYKPMKKQVKNQKLLAVLEKTPDNQYTYPPEKLEKLLHFCTEELLHYVNKEKVFLCQ
ncbi:MAG: DNA photolyase [Chlamydiae bacterium CG10_big_fil_rev_8_21_14_0_10_35_9]|nr:MAG: DNA photolyase [Chlamydiae bacterium CG10_big_fil_rev_8_21_14_0_10_35_9]